MNTNEPFCYISTEHTAARLMHAIDLLLGYLLENTAYAKSNTLAAQSEEIFFSEGGSSNASRSTLRSRRPPPDLSS
jgi:hypothetical protein